jgi:hypothetical protein
VVWIHCHWTTTVHNYYDPFGQFYLLVKIHKEKLGTRPMCSDCVSLIHPLGKWLDLALQPIVTKQHFYFKDSFTLKQELNDLVLPPNASIIAFNVVSIYCGTLLVVRLLSFVIVVVSFHPPSAYNNHVVSFGACRTAQVSHAPLLRPEPTPSSTSIMKRGSSSSSLYSTSTFQRHIHCMPSYVQQLRHASR